MKQNSKLSTFLLEIFVEEIYKFETNKMDEGVQKLLKIDKYKQEVNDYEKTLALTPTDEKLKTALARDHQN